MFHPLIHLYASELADQRKVGEPAAARHARLCIRLVKAAQPHTPAASALNQDIGDIILAAEWLSRHRDVDYEFLIPLGPLLLRSGLWRKALELMSEFLALAEEFEDWHTVVQLRIQQAKFRRLRRELDLAEETLGMVANTLEKIRPEATRLRCESMWLNTLAGILQDSGRLGDAIEALQRGRVIAEKLEDKQSLAMILNSLGGTYMRQGRVGDAICTLEASYPLWIELGDLLGQAMVLTSLGGAYQHQGRFDDAILAFNKSYNISLELDHQRSVAVVLNSLGGVYRRQGRLDAAAKALRRSHALFIDLKDLRGQAMVLNSLGGVFRRQ